jgi:g-D-glutamyl-meso-diaminopimelate peptidase
MERPIVQTALPYDYTKLVEDLRLLQQRYPFLELDSIGESVLGKPIPAVRLGIGPNRIHYNGAFHANEWVTSLLLIKFVEQYAEAYSSGKELNGKNSEELYRRTSLWIVPMVNPDGVELVHYGVNPEHPYYEQLLEWNQGLRDFSNWKANVRGVDLNDQFPAHWEEERDRRFVPGPGMRDYAGTGPLTEPEAAAMADFTKERDFGMVMAFHSQGQEIYWNYRGLEPKESEAMADRLAAASGYRAVKLTDSDAGYKDWFIQEFRRPGFTIEVGLGTNPLPLSQFPQMYSEAAAIMLEGLLLL